MNPDELVRSYRHCRRLAHEAASTFARMFWMLPHDQRRAMEALYAFARHTDDLADGPEPVEEKRLRLIAWRQEFENAVAPQIRHPQSAIRNFPTVLPALADTIERFQVPRDYLRQIIVGVEMDLDHAGFEAWADLRHYCLHVASAVGLACLPIWGCTDERAIEPATDCGLAFQLTNILRDLKEDAARGRMYLPREDLARFECGPEVPAGQDAASDDRWRDLVRFETQRAAQLYDSATATERYLAGSARRMFRLMHATYRALLAKIERDPLSVLTRRLRVSRPHKAWIALRTLVT
jgi:phytoene synthase